MATPRLSGLALLLTMLAAQADELPPPAYQLAAHNAGIPSTVLFAIAQQESGLRVRDRLLPWPWTLNIAGTPYRFATHQAACHALLQALAQHDAKRVDAGLGQTNLGYHGQRFSSPCEALDPYRNLAVTAALLQEHHAATGDWVLAAGRYHRPAGGAPAARYRAGFSQRLEQLLISFEQGTPP
ncbi:lytic transglycosylase [Pseudomonas veronii]